MKHLAALSALMIVACGSSTDTTTDSGNSPPDAGSQDAGTGGSGFTIGGTFSSYGAAGLVLGTSGEPNLTIPSPAGQTFAFANKVPTGTAYAVTVVSQPSGTGATCTVTNGTGTVGNANVTSIVVGCVIQLP
jgi:hypothetical protein